MFFRKASECVFAVSFVGETSNDESDDDNGAEEWLCLAGLVGQ